jgi:hypothetical protein
MIPECHYLMPTDRQCGSPALRGQLYCYFHQPSRRPARRRLRTRYPGLCIDTWPSIDTPEDIQRTLAATLDALANNNISLHHAQTMIYALQLAWNLKR